MMWIKKHRFFMLLLLLFGLLWWLGRADDEVIAACRERYSRGCGVSAYTPWRWWLAEWMVLYWVIRPWSYQHSWPRALLALVLAVLWTVVRAAAVVFGEHSGLHFLWMLCVCIVLLGLMIQSMMDAKRQRRAEISAKIPSE